ncbi:hypothetical protein CKM354_001130800 [Cercospora kikuchii]|uniref:Uncharacterized protein n=1 Tax=Cercospora kikuchii TaxID=84275 RepID=A0A9P3FL79_9PEZI|nr:uncharacterized protein CKM354_001130800 [Cercospora kikuchii]GIZ48240.1 hypothetical protein CKM354_001130800 [Cercospora kikuchii]
MKECVLSCAEISSHDYALAAVASYGRATRAEGHLLLRWCDVRPRERVNPRGRQWHTMVALFLPLDIRLRFLAGLRPHI